MSLNRRAASFRSQEKFTSSTWYANNKRVLHTHMIAHTHTIQYIRNKTLGVCCYIETVVIVKELRLFPRILQIPDHTQRHNAAGWIYFILFLRLFFFDRVFQGLQVLRSLYEFYQCSAFLIGKPEDFFQSKQYMRGLLCMHMSCNYDQRLENVM